MSETKIRVRYADFEIEVVNEKPEFCVAKIMEFIQLFTAPPAPQVQQQYYQQQPANVQNWQNPVRR